MPRRDPFDYFGCPAFELVITRWDGRGTRPVEVYRKYTNEWPWAAAARIFAAGLLRNATGRLRPPQKEVEELADAS
jgi:hypothetical protein